MKSPAPFQVAVIQNKPLFNTEASIQATLALIEQASSTAKLIVLPEMFTTPYEFARMQNASNYSGGTLQQLQLIAKKHSVLISAGSMPVQRKEKLTNTSYLIDESGEVLYEYDKCHLFDVRLKTLTALESKVFAAGSHTSLAQTQIGTIGTVICYDIRFPELARKMALNGMQILTVPAAFNTTTGNAHWHTVMRARAIENQIFICAASPARNKESSYPAYGHSLIINPWGEIVAEAGEDEEIIYGSIDMEALETIRVQMPLLKHRRPNLY